MLRGISTAPAARLALAVGAAFGVGVAAGRGALLETSTSIMGASVCASILLLSVLVEGLSGGYGPVIRAEVTRLAREVVTLREHVVELEVILAALKSIMDSVYRQRDTPRGPASGTGNHPAL